MWEILLGFGLEYIFGSQTTAFEIGGEYVKTTVSGDAAPQTLSKAVVDSANDTNIDPGFVCYRPDHIEGRHMVQIGWNPFTPIVQRGAEELLKLAGQDPYSKGEVY